MTRKFYAGTFLYRNEFHSPGYSNYIDTVVAFDSENERDKWVDEDYAWRGALYAKTAKKHKIHSLKEYNTIINHRNFMNMAGQEQEEYERNFVEKDLAEWERILEEENEK